MAETVFLQRQSGLLAPVDAAGSESIAAFRETDLLKAEITRPRNAAYLRKFFALLKVLYPHQETYPTMKKFRAAVQAALGFAETTVLPDGRVILIPDSISFGAMDDDEFEVLMRRFFVLAETRIIPGVAREDVEREWNDIMAGRQGPSYAEMKR